MMRRWLMRALTAFLAVCSMNAQVQEPKQQPDQPGARQAADNPFDAFQQFSATRSGGLMSDTDRKMYRSGKLMRFDHTDHYRIADLETRSLWLVYPNKCSRAPAMDMAVFPFSRKFRVESSNSIGKETVDGHLCKVADVVLVGTGAIPSKFRMKLFQAEDLSGFPLQIDVENLLNNHKFSIHYTNVSLGAPDAKLFAHPAKCDGAVLAPAEKQKPAKP